MPAHLGPLLLFTFGTLGASAVPPPPPGRSGLPGGNVNVPIGQPVPTMTSSANWPTSAVSKWMTASYTSSLVAPGVSAATSAVQSAFSTTVSYSNGTTRSLPSCAASMNGSVPSSLGFNFSGTIRRYYVAAEEVEWDYAPTGWDNWLGVPFNDSIRAKNAGYLEYGTVWTKALYRGYTDATFTQRTEQPAWQGTQGPILRAEVGDVIEILFVNNLANHYATMHSMGLAYQKSSEGADYPDAEPRVNFKIPEEDAVPPVKPGVAPGGCVVYKWMATELAGPNEGELARLHSYHSYVSLYEDTNTGLIGPTIIYVTGTMDRVMSEYREIPFLFMIYTESTSFLLGVNAKRLTELNIARSEHFPSAPAFHTINGYTFSNNPVFEMCLGDKVLYYTYLNNKQYATSINDGIGKTFIMDATGSGMWQVVCHVDKHLSRGMVVNYKVYSKNCPLDPLASYSS
ncbi:Cupredoxin, partial [Aureobasidium melanogenum]